MLIFGFKDAVDWFAENHCSDFRCKATNNKNMNEENRVFNSVWFVFKICTKCYTAPQDVDNPRDTSVLHIG